MRFLLTMMIAVLTLFASEVHWAEDYKQAQAISQKSNKPIYVFISAPECPWCEKFEKTTLKNEEVIETLNKSFVPLHLERGFDEIPKIFKQRPVPRHYIVYEKNNYFFATLGYAKAKEFIDLLNTTLKEMNK